MPKKKNKSYINFLFPLLILLHAAGQLSLKYLINGLSLRYIRFDNLGNLFTLLLSALIILGYIIATFPANKLQRKDINILLGIGVFLFIPLVIIGVISLSGISMGPAYIFSVPIKKVYLGLLFFLELFFELYLLFIVWGFVVDRKFFSYVRSVYISLISLFFLMFFAFCYTLKYSNGESEIGKSETYDVAVILGAAVWSHDRPSPIFEGRIKKAFDLYTEKRISKIQLTGGNAPGEISEAETAFNYLTDLGVDKDDIVIEKSTSATSEQINFIYNDLIKRHHFSKILIISDAFHLPRILEISKFYGIDSKGVSSEHEINWEKLLFYRVRESVALLMFWFLAI